MGIEKKIKRKNQTTLVHFTRVCSKNKMPFLLLGEKIRIIRLPPKR
jgi:hypothetical protein